MLNPRRRLAVISTCLVLLALPTTAAAGDVASGREATGEVTGTSTCDLQLLVAGGAPVDDHLRVNVGQEWAALGSGFPASTTVTLTAVRASPSAQEAFEIQTDAAGEFGEIFYFAPGTEGGWRIDASVSSDPSCADFVSMTIVTGHPFTDIATHPFDAEITWLYQRGITTGCASSRFCPDDAVTREQMASFLVRALGIPPTSTDFFTDDETSIHEADINALAASGIASGCGTGRFCPTQVVLREQMASFLVRAFGVPASSTDSFADDESSIHEQDINALADFGVATGCGGGNYCPRGQVTRGQMAAFLERTLF